MPSHLIPITLSIGHFLLLLGALEMGYRRTRPLRDDSVPSRSVLESAILMLVSLVLGFSFASASGRFDQRRQLAIDESNDIGTAYLRVDLLPKGAQLPLRKLYLEYVDNRIEFNKGLETGSYSASTWEAAHQIQNQIWAQTVSASRNQSSALLALPPLNATIDISSTRAAMSDVHLPALVGIFIVIVTLITAVLVGLADRESGRRTWIHRIIWSFVLALTTFVISDLDDPRSGFAKIDAVDKLLFEQKAVIEHDVHAQLLSR